MIIFLLMAISVSFIACIQDASISNFPEHVNSSCDLTQKQILESLQQWKRQGERPGDSPYTPLQLTKKDHRAIQKLVTLLGAKSEEDGYLDSRTHTVLSLLPPEVMVDCRKAMRRTWLLDERFCSQYLPADMYCLSMEDMGKALKNKIKLTSEKLCPLWPKNKIEREEEINRKSSFTFTISSEKICNANGKRFNALDKRCVAYDQCYVEVINTKHLKWQELLLLHNAALMHRKRQNGQEIKQEMAQTRFLYNLLNKKVKKHLEANPYPRETEKRTPFELRLREIELGL